MITALFSSYRFKKDISVMIKPFLVEPQALELNPIAVENVLHSRRNCLLFIMSELIDKDNLNLHCLFEI